MIAAIRVLGRAIRDTWDALVVLAVLNVMVLAAAVLVVPLPAAVAALFAVAHDLTRGEEPTVPDFLRTARRLFLRAWAWTIANIFVGSVLWSGFVFYSAVGGPWPLVSAIVLGSATFVWAAAQLFVWPYLLSDGDMSLVRAVRNSVLTVFAAPGFTLVLAVATVGIVVISAVLVLPLVIATGALIAVLASHAVRDRLQAFDKVVVPT